MKNNQLILIQEICKDAQRKYKYAGCFDVKCHQTWRIVSSIKIRLERNLIDLSASVIECLKIAESFLHELKNEAEGAEELIYIEKLEKKMQDIYQTSKS